MDLDKQHLADALQLATNIGLGEDLAITRKTRRLAGAGTWVWGRLNGHVFNALVFPEHAEQAVYELGDSKISKLWLQRKSDKETVANFDRGWDIEPRTPEAALIVDFLCAGLAEAVYAE